MPKPLSDLVGSRWGRLTVVELAGRDASGRAVWRCACDCGGAAAISNGALRAGKRSGCAGCLNERVSAPRAKGSACANFKHGGASRGAHTKEYRSWEAMVRRCTLPSQSNYADYGGRGIAVCAEWRADFEAFLRDMGLAPSDSHSIDRYPNVNGNYEPGNCRWATRAEQANNKRSSRVVSFNGREMTIREWADATGIAYGTLWRRIAVLRWSPERAIAAFVLPEMIPLMDDHNKHPNALVSD